MSPPNFSSKMTESLGDVVTGVNGLSSPSEYWVVGPSNKPGSYPWFRSNLVSDVKEFF